VSIPVARDREQTSTPASSDKVMVKNDYPDIGDRPARRRPSL
jgi:hypothetical protein